jgi:hypothetical protein
LKPTEGIDAVKKQFGLEMSTGNFSAYKTQIRAESKSPRSPVAAKRKMGRPKGSGNKASPTAISGRANPLEAAQQVKALVDRYGADTVKGLAELLGKA